MSSASILTSLNFSEYKQLFLNHDFLMNPVLGGGPTAFSDIGAVGSNPKTGTDFTSLLVDVDGDEIKDGEGDARSIDNVC